MEIGPVRDLVEGVDPKTGELTEAVALDRETFSIQDVREQVHLIQELMRSVMQPGEHYGKVPGCEKDILFKAGAEKLCLTFRMAPDYTIEEVVLENGHKEFRIGCRLTHIVSRRFLGSGVGLCSSMEKKYRYRYEWNQATKKKDLRVENPDIADTYNTVLKMAKKRALVDAVLTATAASDIFTQDLEETSDALQRAVALPRAKEVPQTNGGNAVGPGLDRMGAKPTVLSEEPRAKADVSAPEGEPKSKFFVKLHALAREKGISHERMKQTIAQRFNKQSSKDLIDGEAVALIHMIEDGRLK